MSMALIAAGVALMATAILIWSVTGLLSHRKDVRRRAQPPPLPPQIVRNDPAGALLPGRSHQNPPPLPRSLQGATPHAAIDPRIYSYPKCPDHRLRNVRGQPQVIFWDGEKKMFHCCKGHDFIGGGH